MLLLFPGAALAAPGIPEAFYGTADRSGEVDASIDGVVVASTSVSSGSYGKAPHELFILDPAGDRSGKAISFSLEGAPALESAIFTNGAITKLDLTTAHMPAASSTEAALPDIASVSGGSALPPLVPKKILIPRSFDLTGDRAITLADLAALLAAWGAGPFSPADLNRDGVVGLYDFNLLIFRL